MKRTINISILICVLFISSLNSQTIYLPVSNDVYEFLAKMETKGILNDFRDVAKPLSRMTIAKALQIMQPKVQFMTKVDRENYEFFITEFKYELLLLANDPQPSEIRWHLYSHELQGGEAHYDINYRYEYDTEEGKKRTKRSQGLTTYGYVFQNLGYHFNWIDNLEKGDNINFKKENTPDKGVSYTSKNASDVLEYNQINAQFTWNIGNVDLSLEKIPTIWGYGKTGGVIFTDKAESYPKIKLTLPLSKNIDFTYFHGELNSNVIDSTRSYYYFPHLTSDSIRHVDHQKYIAAHLLDISLFDGIELSFGESVVYSDRGPLLIYIIPIMFFKAGEHYNGDKDNTQIFGTLKLNLIKNTRFFLSLFLDELNTDELFDPDKSRRQVAFNSGLKLYDIGMENLDFYVEYMRANYGVYNHKYAATTFTNNRYTLGSWIGQNADYLYLELTYTPNRKITIRASYDVYRKGEPATILQQYAADGGKLSFLSGKQYEERSSKLTVLYQPIRDLFINCKLGFRNVADQYSPSNNKKNVFEFSAAAQLGLW